ncbi:hypothetical protein [Albidovulum sediminis]|uniref:Uncharacterized protein n=1 Tax=Albidovulum sediminis TaxID=3066345 RepID=A0ABT2NS73_9RHOB|nr:hypothetical protein [Defluviimonas sediminis]MCT8331761.1 hypothetical protein [Defluviimonas sediminis]
MATAGTGTVNKSGRPVAATAVGLGAALAELEQAAPGVAVGIRIVGHDNRVRRLGNAAMNAALAGGVVFDRCCILADLVNGQSYQRLSVVVSEPAAGLGIGARIALVATGLEVLNQLDNLGSASVAA